jgi:hypothetical protein
VVDQNNNYVSPELKALAWKAARMRRKDVEAKKQNRSHQVLNMKTYFEHVLRGASIAVTDERLAKMGHVTGKAGANASARSRREKATQRQCTEKSEASPTKPSNASSPSRFREFLWSDMYYTSNR